MMRRKIAATILVTLMLLGMAGTATIQSQLGHQQLMSGPTGYGNGTGG